MEPARGTLDLLLEAAKATNSVTRRELAISLLQDLEPPAQRALEVLRQHLTRVAHATQFGIAVVRTAAYEIVDLERTLEGIRRIDPTKREGVASLLASLQRQVIERLNSAAVLVRLYPEEPASLAALAAIVREEPEGAFRIFAANELRRAGPAAKAAIPVLKATATCASNPAVRLAVTRALKAIAAGNPR